MEVDTNLAMAEARKIAARKTRGQYPWNEPIGEKRRYFAEQASKAFCDMVLPGGYAQLTAFDGSGGNT